MKESEKPQEEKASTPTVLVATEMSPEALIRLAAEKLEARRGIRAKSASIVAVALTDLADQVEAW